MDDKNIKNESDYKMNLHSRTSTLNQYWNFKKYNKKESQGYTASLDIFKEPDLILLLKFNWFFVF